MTMQEPQPETGSTFAKDNDPVFEQLGICHTCKRRYSNGMDCQAFPEGIPLIILVGDHVHTEPYPGDGGLTYVPVVV
jgi:hypothetical protein